MVLGSKIRLILWFLLLVSVGTGLGLWWSLPGMVEKRLPFYAKEAGLKDFRLEVRSISLFRADLGSVVLGDPRIARPDHCNGAGGLLPLGTWSIKKIRSIKVAGVQSYAQYDGNGFSLRGVKIPAVKPDESAPSPALPEKLPVEISALSLESASLNLDWSGKAFRLPLDARAILRGGGVYDCTLTAYPPRTSCSMPCAGQSARPKPGSLPGDRDTGSRTLWGPDRADSPACWLQGGVDFKGQGGWTNSGG